MLSRKNVAYFCMEYGVSSKFRIYSGGLGILAGDIVKSATDLSLPMTFIGILWKEGYNTQTVKENGFVMDMPSVNPWYEFVEDTGRVVYVSIYGKNVAVKVWKHKEYPLYLLDTDVHENGNMAHITSRLYGGSTSIGMNEEQERIAQEMILGIGGVRALEALGIKPEVYHFNEGHPVFAGIELISKKMYCGTPFENAWDEVTKEIVFTTHTPVPAGNEQHDNNMLISMGANCRLQDWQMDKIGGRPFGMTVAGLRLAYLSNGVSRLHARVAQDMWQWVDDALIIPVTNGVHQPTWQKQEIYECYRQMSLENLREEHMRCKEVLLGYVKEKNGIQLDQNSITIGFARRATGYKRWRLIFNDIPRLERLFKTYNLQLIFSGKSHKNDYSGKEDISYIYQMSKRYPQNVVFLQEYDISVAQLLVSGCDIWLNNPRRPLEACGTSGMKAALNGVLNLSILDGWWDEACVDGANGWAISDEQEGHDQVQQDRRDAESLYEVLEKKVIPAYNDKNAWTMRMFASIHTAEQFTSERMVKDYYSHMYNNAK